MEFRLDLVPHKRRQVIYNLMQLYMYDFSRYQDIVVDDNGKFPEYPGIDEYWRRGTGKHAFLISYDKVPAGFALVDRLYDPIEGDFYMTEFFIMQKYRRTGMGTWAAKALFDRFKGRWKVTQIKNNLPAQAFWRKVIGSYTNERYSEKVHPQYGNISQYFSSL
ncbi:putative acetyltransferase [Paenibacillus favisporus]|uniref:Acetyltransferase n=1 Tax=Paenibacillus favisporus TaxID=221028 RepID=A0ABV2EXF1_9BACL